MLSYFCVQREFKEAKLKINKQTENNNAISLTATETEQLEI